MSHTPHQLAISIGGSLHRGSAWPALGSFSLLGELALMLFSGLPRGFLAKCHLVLTYISLVSSSVVSAERAVAIQVSGNGTTYTGTQVDSQDVFLGMRN